jgi:hypothetical protein
MTTIQLVLVIFGIGSMINALLTTLANRKVRDIRLDPYNSNTNSIDMFYGWSIGIYVSTIIVGIFCVIEYFILGG